MSQDKINSLIFMLVVLFSVLVGGVRRGGPDEIALESRTEKTALTAAASNAITETVAPPVAPPAISAAAAVVKDLYNLEPIYALNPAQQWPVASITKLMTAAVAMDKMPAEERITVSQAAVATEGGAGNLIVGQSYSRDELLSVLLVVSSNDAAAALAEHHGQENFIEAMNERAVALGMYNTRFFDPTGLSPLNQSMAGDLEKLVKYIFHVRPEIFALTRQKEGNIHPFVGRENFIGGKTGFIDEASGNLISLFNHNGRPLLIIVLGSEDRAKDTELLYNVFAQ